MVKYFIVSMCQLFVLLQSVTKSVKFVLQNDQKDATV